MADVPPDPAPPPAPAPPFAVPPAGPYTQKRTTTYKFTPFELSISTETQSSHVPVVVAGCKGCSDDPELGHDEDEHDDTGDKLDAIMAALSMYGQKIVEAMQGRPGSQPPAGDPSAFPPDRNA